MALANVQLALAQLFTGATLRAAYFADPLAVGRALGLDEAEAIILAGLASKEVEQFAAILKRKRAADVGTVLPLTARALGSAFYRHIMATIDGPLPSGRNHADARALVDYMEKFSRSRTLEPPWAADLARYEITCENAFRSGFSLIIRCFRYPVGRLSADLYRGAPIGQVAPRWTIAAWLRVPGSRWTIHRLW